MGITFTVVDHELLSVYVTKLGMVKSLIPVTEPSHSEMVRLEYLINLYLINLEYLINL